MRRLLPLLLVGLSLAPPASAWSLGGDRPPTRIPVPAREISASATDTGGTTVTLDAISFNGEIALYGTVGLAQVTLEFERLQQVAFQTGPDADHRLAVATLTDGSEARVVVEADLPLYGRAAFGNYRIYTEDLRVLVLTPSKRAD